MEPYDYRTIHKAVGEGIDEIVRLLLEASGDVSVKCRGNGSVLQRSHRQGALRSNHLYIDASGGAQHRSQVLNWPLGERLSPSVGSKY